MPPLRERPEDILPLANHVISEFSRGKARFSAAVNECLERYSWPGNVRELRNAMERASLLSRGELILPDHLPNKIRVLPEAVASTELPAGAQLEDVERETILQTLRKHGFSRTETAKALGISRRALIYKLQRYRELGCEVDAR